jgi:hypothetical protein
VSDSGYNVTEDLVRGRCKDAVQRSHAYFRTDGVLASLFGQMLPVGRGVERAEGALEKVVAQLSAGYGIRQFPDELARGRERLLGFRLAVGGRACDVVRNGWEPMMANASTKRRFRLPMTMALARAGYGALDSLEERDARFFSRLDLRGRGPEQDNLRQN